MSATTDGGRRRAQDRWRMTVRTALAGLAAGLVTAAGLGSNANPPNGRLDLGTPGNHLATSAPSDRHLYPNYL